MKNTFSWLIVLISLAIILVLVVSSCQESQASKYYAQGQARSMIIAAQGQARLDAAVATAINMPFVLVGLGMVGLFTIVVLVLFFTQEYRMKKIEAGPKVIVMLLGAGDTRRSFYRALAENRYEIVDRIE